VELNLTAIEKLFNETESLDLDSKESEHLFEQYKLAVEMASRVTQQRQATNRFFITIISALAAAYGVLFTGINQNGELVEAVRFVLPGVVVFITFLWSQSLKYSKALNSAKFTVINKIEERLPASVFRTEWNIMKEKGDKLIGSTKWEIRLASYIMMLGVLMTIFELLKLNKWFGLN
jgi:hypothetical protein